MRAPTGEQFTLELEEGGTRTVAIITEVAASLRVLAVGDVDIVDSYSVESSPPYGSGIVLAPWPNRIRDGVWMLDGEPQQLDITDAKHRNAIHGLLRSRPYRVAERSASAVTLEATVFPQHGYPFILDTSVRYEVVPGGIVVTHRVRNASASRAPFALGAHPFLRVGDVPIGDLTLTLAAGSRFALDDQLIPGDEIAVDGTEFDLRNGRRVGGLNLDTPFGDVSHGTDGRARHRLTAPDGQFTELWQGLEFGFVQVFIPHIFPRPRADDPGAVGQAVAIEPMTAPPDAFNSGVGLRWLEPGEQWSGSWGVAYGRD